ncbi:MAG: hypothetical protein KDK65_04515 [Chlamydiia bacterium]|nr:hypothetical protein [Chlamydiia bacterium]
MDSLRSQDTDALFRGLDARLKERTSQIGHPGQSHLSTRTLALMTLDPYLKASGLEGGSLAETAEALLPFCDQNMGDHLRQLVVTDREIKQLREGGSALENVASYVATKVKGLRAGENALIPGGWHAKPFGHAMLYQFTRTEAGFSIHVFNTGGGSDL